MELESIESLEACLSVFSPEEEQRTIVVAAPSCPIINDFIHYCEVHGFIVIQVLSGSLALQLVSEEQPDIVIIDSTFSDLINNQPTIPFIKNIRKQLSENDIPYIDIIDESDKNQLVELNDIGWKDFIRKPYHPILLLNRVISILHQRSLRERLIEQQRELKTLLEAQEMEQETAATLYQNIVDLGRHDSANVRYDLSPMSIFNGDLILVAYTPANKLYVFLGDFTGHGITASVASVPTAEIFYGMSKKGFSLREIVEEINEKLKKQLPPHMFLAATAVALDPDTGDLQTIACGLPEHILFDKASGEYEIIAADSLPLGVVSNTELNLAERHRKIKKSQSLFLFTDGVIETENNKAQAFGIQGVMDSLFYSGDGFDNILETLAEFRGTKDQQDDITLCTVDCDLNLFPSQKKLAEKKTALVPASSWKFSLSLEADSLKNHNPTPHILHYLIDIQGLGPYREKLFVILSELFSNALDYGLLQLDSALKHSTEGINQYFAQRQYRLDQLKNASIQIDITHRPKKDGGELTISVKDSGDGFCKTEKTIDLHENADFSGRGIALVEKICDELRYSENGTKATAVFCW